MDKRDLIPCPHCGNEVLTILIREGRNGFRDRYSVLCDYNEGGCGAESGWYHSRNEAIWSWNRRTDCGNGRWKSVELSPPRNGEYLYVYTKFKEVDKMYRIKNSKTGNYFWVDEFGKYCDDDMVTHWRPLFDAPGKDVEEAEAAEENNEDTEIDDDEDEADAEDEGDDIDEEEEEEIEDEEDEEDAQDEP